MSAYRIIDRPSPNRGPRPHGTDIDMLILHYTGMETAEAALMRLCDPAAKVSAHYVVDEDGTVTRLVAEEMRAWHAGESCWRGAANINDRSIGIELVNPGHAFGYRPFPEPQIAALTALAIEVRERHRIPPGNVVGHSDVAPGRKMDPGELFDWRRLAGAGIGLWPDPAALSARPAAEDDSLAPLAEIGYALGEPGDPATRAAIAAFQRHYRPGCIDGRLDGETAALIGAVCAKSRQAP